MGNDRLIGIEGLDGSCAADVLVGDAGPNFLDGHLGDDTLYGRAGKDDIHGGFGYDKLYGQRGDDYLYGGYYTFDFYNGGPGQDSCPSYGGANDTKESCEKN